MTTSRCFLTIATWIKDRNQINFRLVFNHFFGFHRPGDAEADAEGRRVGRRRSSQHGHTRRGRRRPRGRSPRGVLKVRTSRTGHHLSGNLFLLIFVSIVLLFLASWLSIAKTRFSN